MSQDRIPDTHVSEPTSDGSPLRRVELWKVSYFEEELTDHSVDPPQVPVKVDTYEATTLDFAVAKALYAAWRAGAGKYSILDLDGSFDPVAMLCVPDQEQERLDRELSVAVNHSTLN